VRLLSSDVVIFYNENEAADYRGYNHRTADYADNTDKKEPRMYIDETDFADKNMIAATYANGTDYKGLQMYIDGTDYADKKNLNRKLHRDNPTKN
jgi:hypothetical protein